MTRDTLRQHILERHAEGMSVESMYREYDVPKSTLYRWIRHSKRNKPQISDDDIQTILDRITHIEEEARTYKKVLQLIKYAEKEHA